MHQQHMAIVSQTKNRASDGRQLVKFPDQMREHTLANMRDHLLALQEIQTAFASSDYDRAADVAETRLGMTALTAHGAHDASRFMPAGMQAIGSGMHRAASRFAQPNQKTNYRNGSRKPRQRQALPLKSNPTNWVG